MELILIKIRSIYMGYISIHTNLNPCMESQSLRLAFGANRGELVQFPFGCNFLLKLIFTYLLKID